MKEQSPTSNKWHSPYSIYQHVDRVTKKFGIDAIEKKPKFKPVRESRMAAITALAAYKHFGEPFFVQLNPSDPPDAYLMVMQNQGATRSLSMLELTTYMDRSGKSFIEELKKKAPSTYQRYGERYVLAYEMRTTQQIDYNEAREYLMQNRIPFPVWTFQPISLHPDTVGKMVIINPQTKDYIINFGEAGHDLIQARVPPVIYTFQVKDPKLVRREEAPPDNSPPWNPDIERE